MKKLLFIIAVACGLSANAQITAVNLQASGLTCSMCSNAINKSLKTLDFVDKVDANIKNSSFAITFKTGAVVDIDKIKKKVEDAGFFVARLTATVRFDNVQVQNDHHINVGPNTFHFLHIKDQVLNGEKELQVLDKGYVTAKEYKKNGSYTTMDCYKTGVAGSCCAKADLPMGKRIFHVTI
jgi:copper chaperone CopZ